MEEVTNLPQKQTQGINHEASDTERWASIIGGSALVLLGLPQRSLRGALMALAGGGLVYQAINKNSTLQQAQETIENTLGVGQTIRVEKTVTINKSAEDLYKFWRNFENLPRFMKHLQSVTVYDEQRSHWVTKAPLENTVEWDAQIIKDEPNQLIAWASVGDAQIDHSGFVRFRPATGDRGTEVKIVIEYNPPGGIIGQTITKLFGEAPEQQIGDELNRFKQLMEAGEIATTEGQPKGS
ncbi:cyclase/dehydrase [Gloeothece citriformis PCC 7424]|uniref:Cyclase/dehydrase n=1 Tax=Gloeothece citriformis (strain PCC 7424) TaxID=65393 RepID=B7K7M6_GLOC7|nr:SRPBCC family protein [Gloeothece citriformis]ACK69794.1 cyclase/dehydrase [Gloeothece citriformis PCC 7424]